MRDLITIMESFHGATFYHATEAENVDDIMTNGFQGGWGDAGLGVYFYDNIYDAQAYVAKGGWDGALKNPVIIAVQDSSMERVPVLSDEWDASLYANMWWHDMEDGDEDDYWKPQYMEIVRPSF